MAVPTVYVDKSFVGVSNGSQTNPYTTIAAAIAAANDQDTISIAAGDYTGSPVDIPAGKALNFVSANAGTDPDNWTHPEVIIDRIVSLSSVSVDGIHVHATIGGDLDTTSSNGPYWQGIGTSAAGLAVTVKNSVIDGHASGAINPGFDQPFGLNLTYGGDNVVVDHVHFLPFTGLDPANTAYGIWINGTAPTSSVTITNNEFDTGAPRNAAIAFDGEHDGANIVITGNSFEDPGTSPGAIRFFDFADVNHGTQTFPGITGNSMDGDGPIVSNESGDNVVVNSNDVVTGTSANETFVADGGNDTVDGAGGTDTYDMSASDTGSVVDLGAHKAFSANTGHDTITNIENLKGGVGDDDFTGDGGDNVVYASGGHDTIDGGNNSPNGDTFDASSAATTVNVNLTTGAVTGAFTATLTNIENATTGAGDDTITLSSASNAVDGGGGVDTVVIAESYSADAIGYAGGTFTHTGGDTLTNVEKAQFNGKTVWLVHNSAELTTVLASGATGAHAGDIIKLASGPYSGTFTVATANLTIESATGNAADVVFTGNVRSANSIPVGTTLNQFLTGGGASNGNAGFVVSANGLTLNHISITEYRTGIDLQSNTGLTIDGVVLDDNINGIYKETSSAVVSGFTLKDSIISDGYQGLLVEGTGGFTDVEIVGTTFTNLLSKGMYFEQLNEADIHDIIMNNVGQYGRVPAFGGTGVFGAGIDINLKHASSADIDIHDFTFTNVGSSTGAGSPHFGGAAIAVKARDDGSNGPTTLDHVTIEDGTINGTSTGIRIGEPTKANAGPTHVEVHNVEVTNASLGEYDNRTGSTLTVNIDPQDLNVSSNPDATGVIAYIDSTNGNTTYTVNEGDTVTENSATGTDTVNARGSFTLGANVENLNLVDAGSGTETFENFNLGGIANGENGWKSIADGRDQAVVDLSGNKVFKMSSDPSSGDFAGPYSPDIGVTAGEPTTTADGDVHILKFRVKPVSTIADNSRLEVDIGSAKADDRNNFMVVESIAGQGFRVAVADPLLDGHWNTGVGQDDFSAFTGNRTLVSGLDPSQWHDIELHVIYKSGANNDVIEVYVDGAKVGETTTFENFRDSAGGTHAANADANQTNRIFFRPGAGGATTDGPGGANQGFYFDDITNTVTTDSTATGNSLANVINGNSGHNIINGMGGNDTINGNDGNDTIDGGTGIDSINGGRGNDLIKESASDADIVDGGAGTDTLQIDGTSGNDTVVALYDGTKLVSINGGAISNIELVNLSLAGNTAVGDTLSYATSTHAVTVNLATGTASGFASIAGVENVIGSSAGDNLIGDGNANVFTGGLGNDSIDGAGGIDTAVFSGNINDYAIQYDSVSHTYAVTRVGTSEIDSVTGVEKFSFNGTVFDVTGSPNLITNRFDPSFSSGTTANFNENVANPTVYTAAATDADSAAVFGDIKYSLEGPDAGLFTINASTGVVKLIGAANFEADPSYAITVRATQGITSSTRSVTLSVNDLNDNNPVFQSGGTASVNENAANAVVYDANATDADASFGNIVYSLEGANASAFTINAATGVVVLTGAADFETQPSYALTVRATQGTTSTTKAVTVSVNDLNDNAPVFQSGATASVNENASTSLVVYDANATDADSAATFGAIVYSLSGTDAGAFTIDAATGQVRLKVSADFETKNGYAFAVTATQGSTATTQNVSLAVNNVNEGGLGTVNLSVEAGSTKAPVGSLGTAGTSFDVINVNAGGGTVLNGTSVLMAGQTLTLAQANALTFSSGVNSGSVQLLAHNGVDTSTVQVNLSVTAGVSKTYTGTSSSDRLDGANGKDIVLGKGGADSLLGGAGNDSVNGGKGNDTISGGKGHDTLVGGSGADSFVFDIKLGAKNADDIKGFVHGADMIWLDHNIFAAIGADLGHKEFRANLTGDAQDKSDKIIYNTDTGQLYYDADGNQSGAKVLIATLDPHLTTLSHLDFDIV